MFRLVPGVSHQYTCQAILTLNFVLQLFLAALESRYVTCCQKSLTVTKAENTKIQSYQIIKSAQKAPAVLVSELFSVVPGSKLIQRNAHFRWTRCVFEKLGDN